jgi:hypothetical protein
MGPRDREAFAPRHIALARPGPGGNVETSPPFTGLEAIAHANDGFRPAAIAESVSSRASSPDVVLPPHP